MEELITKDKSKEKNKKSIARKKISPFLKTFVQIEKYVFY